MVELGIYHSLLDNETRKTGGDPSKVTQGQRGRSRHWKGKETKQGGREITKKRQRGRGALLAPQQQDVTSSRGQSCSFY